MNGWLIQIFFSILALVLSNLILKNTKISLQILKKLFLRYHVTQKSKFFEYKIENVKFFNVYQKTADGLVLGMWVLEPLIIDKNTKCVVALHGTGSNRRDFVTSYRVDRFVAYNYILIVPEYRQFGDSKGIYDIKKVNYDVENACDYCLNKYNLQPILFGFSLGGSIALEYAQSKNFKNKIILLNSFKSTIDILEIQKLWKIVIFIIPWLRNQVKNNFNYDNMKSITKIESKNILIMHGNADEMVPFNHSIDMANLIGCKLIIFPNKGHHSVFDDESVFFESDRFIRK
ncbi:hypothetical protein GVAV_001085 [Gurleya vavrai]